MDESGIVVSSCTPGKVCSQASVRVRIDYTPARQATLQGQIIDQLPGFTGHETLKEHGLVHMNGRIYSPKYARFLSADPTVPYPTRWYSYNRYMYVGGNPASRYDPSGFTDLYADGQCPSCNEPPIVVTAPTPPVQSFDQYWTNQAANSAIDQSYSGNDSYAQKGGRSANAQILRQEKLNILLKGAQDGHITLEEAKAWYRHGGGASLNADMSKIDFGSTSISDFPNGVGSSECINTFFKGTPDGNVYGTIKLTLTTQSTVVATFGYDDYDFNINWSDGRLARNVFTKFGELYHGSGTPFRIYLQGTGTLNP